MAADDGRGAGPAAAESADAERPWARVRRVLGPDGVAWLLIVPLLWPVPLLNRLHVESGAVLALAAWFVAGYAALRAFAAGHGFGPVLRGRVTRIALPAVLMTVPLAWAPNCGYVEGFGYFLLFVVPTAVLATSAAWAQGSLRAGRAPSVGRLFARHAALGIVLVVIGPAYDLLLHPQFYTYNHVFGAIVGPVYDEELVWRPGLVAFRALTLVWAVVLFAVGSAARARATRDLRRVEGWLALAGLAGLVLAAGYSRAGRLGIVTTVEALRQTMPATVDVGTLRLHADSLDARTVGFAAHAAHRLDSLLGVRPSRPVEVWIYPDASTRARLTGARVTSVAPVWLREPQVHVLAEQFEDLFPHELVHAYAREFGMPVLRASPAVGLVEGLAVALEPPDGGPSPAELVAADRRFAWADNLEGALSPWGFWTGRGGVSYAVTGAFVGWLLDRYGAEPLRTAYRTGSPEAAYGRPVRELAAAWQADQERFAALPVDARARAGARFDAPSLFERRCPHWVPRWERARRRSAEALEQGDIPGAVREAEDALDRAPEDPAVRAAWARALLAAARYEEVRARLATWPDSTRSGALRVVAADLAALSGDSVAARAEYDRVRRAQPASARETRALLVARHALAGRPDVLRRLRGADATSVVAMVDSFGTSPGPGGGRGEWERQVLAWQSDAVWTAGDLDAARAFAVRARDAYAAVGDDPGARFQQEAVQRFRWLVSRSSLPGQVP